MARFYRSEYMNERMVAKDRIQHIMYFLDYYKLYNMYRVHTGVPFIIGISGKTLFAKQN